MSSFSAVCYKESFRSSAVSRAPRVSPPLQGIQDLRSTFQRLKTDWEQACVSSLEVLAALPHSLNEIYAVCVWSCVFNQSVNS